MIFFCILGRPKPSTMKNFLKITTVFFLFCIHPMTAQEMKYYIEENGKLFLTTKVTFEKSIDHSKNVDVYLENDKGQIGIVYIRRRDGKLDAEQMKELKAFLKAQSGISVNDNEYIGIHYLSAQPETDAIHIGTHGYRERKTQRKLLKIVPSKYFHIYAAGGRNDKITAKDKKVLTKDENRFIHKMFFPVEMNYGNVVVVRPDGTYKIYLGEYNPDEIYKMAEALKAMP